MKIYLGVSENGVLTEGHNSSSGTAKNLTVCEGRVLKFSNDKGMPQWDFFTYYLSQLLALRAVYNIISSAVSVIYKQTIFFFYLEFVMIICPHSIHGHGISINL